MTKKKNVMHWETFNLKKKVTKNFIQKFIWMYKDVLGKTMCSPFPK